MLVVMHAHAGEAEIARVCEKIESLGFRPHVMPGAERTAIGITGNHGPVDHAEFESLPGVAEAIPVSKPYKLAGPLARTLLVGLGPCETALRTHLGLRTARPDRR